MQGAPLNLNNKKELQFYEAKNVPGRATLLPGRRLLLQLQSQKKSWEKEDGYLLASIMSSSTAVFTCLEIRATT